MENRMPLHAKRINLSGSFEGVVDQYITTEFDGGIKNSDFWDFDEAQNSGSTRYKGLIYVPNAVRLGNSNRYHPTNATLTADGSENSYTFGMAIDESSASINDNLDSLIYKVEIKPGEIFNFESYIARSGPSMYSWTPVDDSLMSNDDGGGGVVYSYFTWKYIETTHGDANTFVTTRGNDNSGAEIEAGMVIQPWSYSTHGGAGSVNAYVPSQMRRLNWLHLVDSTSSSGYFGGTLYNFPRKFSISIINTKTNPIYLKLVSSTHGASVQGGGPHYGPHNGTGGIAFYATKRAGIGPNTPSINKYDPPDRFAIPAKLGIGSEPYLPLDVYNSGGMICGYSHYDTTSQTSGVILLSLSDDYQRIPIVQLNVIFPASNVVEISLTLGLRDSSSGTDSYARFRLSDNSNPAANASWGAALGVSNFADVAVWGGVTKLISQIQVKWVIHGDRISKAPGDHIKLYFHANRQGSDNIQIYNNGAWGPIIAKAISLPANGIYGTALS